MQRSTPIQTRDYRVFTRKQLDRIPQIQALPDEQRLAIEAVSAVLPFRVNNYVIEDLIDWSRVPDDPIYQLTFPQAGMLEPEALATLEAKIRDGADRTEIAELAREIQLSLNPHPAGQVELNMPMLDGRPMRGLQHKYRETVLFFPAQGQTCHAYCTYCFRWAQFVGIDELKFIDRDAGALIAYLREHPEVTDVLFTGGDPMVMRTKVLRRYFEALLAAGLPNLRTIRIGTKAPAYWPYRFVTDADAGDLTALFRQVVDAGVHLSIMAHYSHPVELSTEVAREAVRRIRSTGAEVRCQAPLIRHVNDDAQAWADLWQAEVELGAVPYYLFVERDTGARNYFEVPLVKALEIYQQAYASVSGLARTVRGPSMSATPGKVCVEGVTEVAGEKVFVLKFLQGRDPRWTEQVFFAKYDRQAVWLDDLQPAFGETEFFFEEGLREIERAARRSRKTAARPKPGGSAVQLGANGTVA